MQKIKEYRNLKVVEKTGHKYKSIPGINIKGVWLEQLGFKIGDSVSVHCEEGVLTIKKS